MRAASDRPATTTTTIAAEAIVLLGGVQDLVSGRVVARMASTMMETLEHIKRATARKVMQDSPPCGVDDQNTVIVVHREGVAAVVPVAALIRGMVTRVDVRTRAMAVGAHAPLARRTEEMKKIDNSRSEAEDSACRDIRRLPHLRRVVGAIRTNTEDAVDSRRRQTRIVGLVELPTISVIRRAKAMFTSLDSTTMGMD